MERKAGLKEILLVYTRNIELFHSIQTNFDCKLALYRKRRKKNLLILQSLRKQQLLLLAALEQKATQRTLWKLNRQSVFWEVDCNCNDEQFFKSHFRINRSSFNMLCGLLNTLHKTDTNWRSAIALPKRVAIALFTLGSSGDYRVVSELFGVGKSTVGTILMEFCEEVWQALSSQYIKKLPPTQETVAECVEGFEHLGVPQCLGAIDGCHIEIRPNSANATDYFNYKGWYSIVLLALVDYRYRFLYINVGAPGTCNDTEIYNSSLLKKVLTGNEVLTANKKNIGGVQMPVYILGDSAFPFSTTLMKPYASTVGLTDEQKLFNYKLSKCRKVAEIAFGNLKARFRRIEKGIDNRSGNAPIVIRACCVLHNFLNERNDSINQMWLESLQEFDGYRKNPTYNVAIDDNEPAAEFIRQTLCYYFSCNADADADVLARGDGETRGSGGDGEGRGILGDASGVGDEG